MEIAKRVNDYYGSVPKNNFVCTQPKFKLEKFDIPEPIMEASYGCANPLPRGIHKGMSITDLGCGAGRDACYMGVLGASRIIGIDAAIPLLNIAKEHAKPFIESMPQNPEALFLNGQLEDLSSVLKNNLSENESIQQAQDSDYWKQDLFISNCVLSLCPIKSKVLEEVWKSLKTGGEFYFSDMYCTRRVEKELLNHDELLNSGMSNAFYWKDFITTCKDIGFLDVRVKECTKLKTIPSYLQELVGADTLYYSITFRLFKNDNFEPTWEDYGDEATYLGGIRGEEQVYNFDVNNTFDKNVPKSVDKNLAIILKNSWLNQYFKVTSSDKSVHMGPHISGSVENDLSLSILNY